ncbi:hypothetical protein HPB48_005622 [Haemaphysalis longicornis]|uniref:Brinker DNA-binding domain-containing protein n=1 Tax=Haemaphysalis longicornis TaxID=44386 RepID=A0A9J6G7C9_HAELO|nr:hypothetical protein HPB48_005622 [Haemaphysalis longicornis]
MSTVRRQPSTAQQKLKIIAVAEEFTNREAGRRHDVDESCVRQWRKKDGLEAAHRDLRSLLCPTTGAYPELKGVWEKRPSPMLARRSMLVLDSFRRYTTEE